MAINLNTRYPDNSDVDSEYLVGKARNESYDGAKDYFPLEATWVNELLGFFSALLYRGGLTPNGNPETRLSSQYFDAINSLSVSMNRLGNGYRTQLLGELGFGDPLATNGRTSLIGVAGYGGYISSKVSSSKTNPAECRLFNGGIRYEGNTGDTHVAHSILFPIPTTMISANSNASCRWLVVDSYVFYGVSLGIIYKFDLIMQSSNSTMVAPVLGEFFENSGNLVLYKGYSTYNSPIDLPLTDYTQAFLRLEVDPDSIS